LIKSKNKIFLISEIHPQHSGSLDDLKTMALQSKVAGADSVKVQLYSSLDLHGNDKKAYLEITFEELKNIKAYCEKIEIDLFASVFDIERFDWCEELNFKYYKVASRVSDSSLIEKMIETNKLCFISNGFDSSNFSWAKYDNVKYFYCIPEYPTFLENIKLPTFGDKDRFQGFSDHTFGTTACFCAMSKGATYIEKHFTLSKGMQNNLEKAHLGSMTFSELQKLKQFSLDVRHFI